MADRPYNVLVVDDHEDTRRLLEAILSADEGFQPLVSGSDVDARERMHTHAVDLFLVDLTLPQQRGYALLRDIRSNPTYRDTPITVLTTRDDPDERIRAFDLGATDLIAKPFHVKELLARLRGQTRLKALQDRLSDESTRDSLTGLPNRRRLEEALDQAHRLARRGEASALAMIDVDYFKAVNDRFGHPLGDRVLQGIAWALSETVRDTDLVARFGGDEFAVVLGKATEESADRITTRLLDRVRRTRFGADGDGSGGNVTVSVGIAFVPDPRLGTPEAWVRAADAALYQAKTAGRDQAVVWGRREADAEADGGILIGDLAALRECVDDLAQEIEEKFVDRLGTLVAKVEMRQGRGHDHAERVRDRAIALARGLGLPEREIRVIGWAALVRDIGKLAISPKILGQRGPLTTAQRRVIEEHPALSVTLLRTTRLLTDLLPIVRHHHERWDGGGYPDGLAGDRIPFGARIVGLVDAVMAMEAARPDRPAFSPEEVRDWVTREAGRQFDPNLVARFFELRGHIGAVGPNLGP